MLNSVRPARRAITKGAISGTACLTLLASGSALQAQQAQEQPLVPLLAAGKASVEAVVAGWYFYQMPAKEKRWCTYCIVGALCNWGIAVLTLAEAASALKTLRGR